jgi:rhodanese-related sulfurtransferase
MTTPTRSATDHWAAKVEYETSPLLMKEALDAGVAIALDARPAEDYERGHVPGAINIPLEELVFRIDELPRDKIIIAYGFHVACRRAPRSCLMLSQEGFEARELLGGYEFYKSQEPFLPGYQHEVRARASQRMMAPRVGVEPDHVTAALTATTSARRGY